MKSNILIVWLTLLVLSCTAWLLSNSNIQFEGLVPLLIVLGFLKIWMIIHYFMEIKEAPGFLKWLCEGWAVLSCVSILGAFYILYL